MTDTYDARTPLHSASPRSATEAALRDRAAILDIPRAGLKPWQLRDAILRAELADTAAPAWPQAQAEALVALSWALHHGWVRQSPWDRAQLAHRMAAGLSVDLPRYCDDASFPSAWSGPGRDEDGVARGVTGSGTGAWEVHQDGTIRVAVRAVSLDGGEHRHPPERDIVVARLTVRADGSATLVWGGAASVQRLTREGWAFTGRPIPSDITAPPFTGGSDSIEYASRALGLLEILDRIVPGDIGVPSEAIDLVWGVTDEEERLEARREAAFEARCRASESVVMSGTHWGRAAMY